MIPKMRILVNKTNINLPFSRLIHTVVFIRHGESTWNREKRFTGWCDIPLTTQGEADAKDAGILMGERGLKFDVAFTSTLERAWRTCAITLSASGQAGTETIRSWKLNERHYGALQGHYKDCPKLINAFGEEKLIEWRRSFNTAPPSLYDREVIDKIGDEALVTSTCFLNDKYIDKKKFHMLQNRNNKSMINESDDNSKFPYPNTESLKQCQERAYGFWKEVICPRVLQGERVLIVAHANTIRALVKAVDNIDDELIAHLKIPNGVPLVYTLDENLQPIVDLTDDIGFQAKYLVSARNHGRTMAYERCVRKKMRSLFEYLDTDNDNRITPDCLLRGLSRLQSFNLDGSENSLTDPTLENQSDTKLYKDICEYEIEELMRCVPKADETGGITLQAFLDSEATLLPRLSKLHLLQ